MSAAAKNDSATPGAGEARMGVLAHLEELRRRLIWVVAALLLATVVCFELAPQLFEILRGPLADITRTKLQVLGPLELFVTYLKLAFLAAIFVTAPWTLFQVWLFVSPALYRHEKRWIVPFVLLGSLFFFAGGIFAFEIVLPLGFRYLDAMVPATVETQYSVALYFTLVVRMIVAFGIVFELPLVMWVLAAAGLVAPKRFASFRRYWLVIAFVVAAILTPPDPFTQTMMAVPLVVFFELGVLGARLLYRRREESVQTALSSKG